MLDLKWRATLRRGRIGAGHWTAIDEKTPDASAWRLSIRLRPTAALRILVTTSICEYWSQEAFDDQQRNLTSEQ
jgi:hypothetical protein